MELLTNKTMEDDNVKKMTNLIKRVITNSYEEKSFSFSKLVTYQEFRKYIYNFIISIMHIFLDSNNFHNDKYVVTFEKLPNKIKGYFIDSQKYDNILAINEEVIKNIYNGNIESFASIFHELNHFKVKYDIKSGVINKDIVRIIKERLIRKSKDIFSNPATNDNYYCDNYYYYSEELYVNLQAKKDLLFVCKSLTNDVTVQEKIGKAFDVAFKNEIEEERKRYNNYIRDFTSRFDFNSYYLSYEVAFDLLICDNPEWLQYPQIELEYYIDENNKVQKKSIEQLSKLLNDSKNSEEIDYINKLISNSKNSEEIDYINKLISNSKKI